MTDETDTTMDREQAKEQVMAEFVSAMQLMGACDAGDADMYRQLVGNVIDRYESYKHMDEDTSEFL